MFTKKYSKPFENQEEQIHKLHMFIDNIIDLIKGWIQHKLIIEVETKEQPIIIKKRNFKSTDKWIYNIRITRNKKL